MVEALMARVMLHASEQGDDWWSGCSARLQGTAIRAQGAGRSALGCCSTQVQQHDAHKGLARVSSDERRILLCEVPREHLCDLQVCCVGCGGPCAQHPEHAGMLEDRDQGQLGWG